MKIPMIKKFKLLTILLIIFASNTVLANNKFSKNSVGSNSVYTFEFRNSITRNNQRLQISMPHNWIEYAQSQENNFSSFQNARSFYTKPVQNFILNWVNEYNKHNNRDAINVSFKNDSISINYQKIEDYENLKNILDRVEERAKQMNAVKKLDDNRLIIDYHSIVNNYKNPSKEIMNQIMRQIPSFERLSFRNQVEILSDFIQSIPYNTPNNRFRHPVSVINENMGDCDEKSVLLGLLIKSLPNSKGVSLMYLNKALNNEDHMIILVEMDSNASDVTINLAGTQYIPIETTATVSIGRLHKSVLDQINRKEFFTIKI